VCIRAQVSAGPRKLSAFQNHPFHAAAAMPWRRNLMIFDQATLLSVAMSITGLLGVFLLLLWLQDPATRALAWWGGAYVVGSSAVSLWGAQDVSPLITPEMPNAVLFMACGAIWSGARQFHGRSVLPGGMVAGAVLWFLAMQQPAFSHSEHQRIVLSSLVVALYAFLTAFELRRERRKHLADLWLSIVIPILHASIFLVPVLLIALLPASVSPDRLFSLFAAETVIYVVGTAFVVVVLAKEHTVLIHKTAAMTDLLTGLFNRRAFLEAANRMIGQRARKAQPVSVLAFDLDKFKSINDRFGHAVGDDALKLFAATASANVRATDVIGRLGGEEFAAIIPGGTAEAALVAERLRAAFQAAGVAISGHAIGATVSIGVATAIPPVSVDVLLARADALLYRAKNNGRNRVETDDGVDILSAVPAPITASPQGLPALQDMVIAA
jgi:diguanylate cyclase (GGDEF)-like protein